MEHPSVKKNHQKFNTDYVNFKSKKRKLGDDKKGDFRKIKTEQASVRTSFTHSLRTKSYELGHSNLKG